MDENIVDQSLRKVTKGAGIFIFGTIIGLSFALLSKIILARYLSVDDFGIYNLAISILLLTTSLGALGLTSGIPRMMGYYRGKKNKIKLNSVIIYSLEISIISGIILGITIFLLSDIISIYIFHEKELSNILKIISLAIPLSLTIYILISIFRGFDDPNPKLIFQDFLEKGLIFIIFLVLIITGFSIFTVIFGYFLSILVTLSILILYSFKKIDIVNKKNKIDKEVRKKLLSFSLPLLINSIVYIILLETDIIMIGYFWDVENVGLYSSAKILAINISLILPAFGYLYTPIASKLFAENKIDDLKRIYVIITKWCFLIIIPVFLIMLVYPIQTIEFLLGNKYIGAGLALQILLFGFMIHVFFGPNGSTLVVLGKTKLLMGLTSIAAAINIFLNVIFIPIYGITGAALATTISYSTSNLLISIYLYKQFKITAISEKYIKSILLGLLVIIFIFLLLKILMITTPFFILLISFLTFMTTYYLLILITKNLDREDLSLMKSIEKRTGIRFKFIKKLIKKFY